MIDRREILDVARDLGLQAQVVEKDYVLGWLLAGIYNQERLRPTWVFKGGTCLKKCYFETYRFSEDLGFHPDGRVAPRPGLPRKCFRRCLCLGLRADRHRDSGRPASVRRFPRIPGIASAAKVVSTTAVRLPLPGATSRGSSWTSPPTNYSSSRQLSGRSRTRTRTHPADGLRVPVLRLRRGLRREAPGPERTWPAARPVRRRELVPERTVSRRGGGHSEVCSSRNARTRMRQCRRRRCSPRTARNWRRTGRLCCSTSCHSSHHSRPSGMNSPRSSSGSHSPSPLLGLRRFSWPLARSFCHPPTGGRGPRPTARACWRSSDSPPPTACAWTWTTTATRAASSRTRYAEPRTITSSCTRSKSRLASRAAIAWTRFGARAPRRRGSCRSTPLS